VTTEEEVSMNGQLKHLVEMIRNLLDSYMEKVSKAGKNLVLRIFMHCFARNTINILKTGLTEVRPFWIPQQLYPAFPQHPYPSIQQHP